MSNTTNRRLQAAEACLRLAAEDRAEAVEAVANGGRKQALRQLAWADERLALATDRWAAELAAERKLHAHAANAAFWASVNFD